ncbi:MIP/aquaporin family protein [Phytoactinopolyspora halotolerans]|uniref:Aquaporin family protein n=1 Tax=Phytoactinopolyspora halotolerans TaxID=1981512 RepID=A0A6L9S7D2_9ACTN|nr:MIP/aquaporin family protein [Phytoactinopolyspora halotolerans]NEE00979.1 aquaporin family protein [Phytoactinopolyspora halotolerans]
MSDEAATEPQTTERQAAARRAPPVAALASVGAEIVGTFILVFFGAGTVVALQEPVGGPVDLPPLAALAIGIAFGFAVLICVYAFLHVSGAHINPTVTVGLAAVGKFPWRLVPGYLAAQLAGAVLAALALWMMFSGVAREDPVNLGTTAVGDRGWGAAFATEVILGAILVIVVMATAVDERATAAGTGLAIGLTIAAGVIVTLNVSGGSFNAARTLGPMIVAADFSHWWLYLIAPTLGGVLGAFCYDKLLQRGELPA